MHTDVRLQVVFQDNGETVPCDIVVVKVCLHDLRADYSLTQHTQDANGNPIPIS